jgi:dipeptidyl aminopeptidase/acylaminoacyl peptidase
MNRKWLWVPLIVLTVIAGPVVLRQLFPSEPRPLVGERLDHARYTEVRFRNEEQGIDLAGLLYLPAGEGPFPGVAIIHGSGPSRRDNRWYITLAHHLQESGIAVLLPDKRGSEQSGGDWTTASMQDLATDTVAAVGFLAQRPEIAPGRTGIVGMSQGGWVAPVAASEDARIRFVVNMVGAAVPAVDQLRYEENLNLRQMGLLPGLSNLVALASVHHLVNRAQKPFWDANRDFDPVNYWRRAAVPVLVLYGAEDSNVPSQASAERLRSLGLGSMEVAIFPGSGHALQDPPGQGDRLIRHEALSRISDFILQQGA